MSCVVLGKFPNLHYIYLSSDGMLMVPHRTEMVQDELSATWQAPNTLPEGQKHMRMEEKPRTVFSFPCQIRCALYGTNPKSQ